MINLTTEEAASGFYYGYTRVDLPMEAWRVMRAHTTNVIDSSFEDCVESIEYKVKSVIEKTPKHVCILHSSGVDSTFMLCMALECFESKDITVVSIGPEADVSKRICEYLGVEYTYARYSSEDARWVLNKLKNEDVVDTWFYSSSIIPTSKVMYVASMLGAGSILTGDGGDELFCGYDRYLVVRYLPYHTPLIRRLLWLCKSDRMRKLRQYFLNGYEGLVTNWGYEDINKLVPSKDGSPHGFLNHPFENISDDVVELLDSCDVSLLSGLMLIDIGTELFGVETQKVVTAYKMIDAVAIDDEPPPKLCSPFMNFGIIEQACSIPIKYKYTMRHGRKRLLRHSIDKRFPAYKEIVDKSKKGFAAHGLSEWLKTDLLDLVSFLSQEIHHTVNPAFCYNTIADHIKNKKDNTQKIWGLLTWKALSEKILVKD